MMKKRSHKLAVEPDYRFFLIGISSHENDYHLCWAINQKMNLNLQKKANYVLYNPKIKDNREFSFYAYEDDDSLLIYYLLSNRCKDGFLVEELRNIDFLMQVHGELSEEEKGKMIQNLRSMPVIIGSFTIDPQSLKSRDRLLLH